jgi:small subunit ribosomal protein S16
MAVRIRLSRFGRLHRPYFRIIAIDSRRHREGEASEVLGSYDPQKLDKNMQVDMTRVEAWVERGAQISDSLRNLMKFSGYLVPTPKKTAAVAAPVKRTPAAKPKAGTKQPHVTPTRRALRKHAAKVKGVRKAATAVQVAAAAAAKAAAAPAEAAPQS